MNWLVLSVLAVALTGVVVALLILAKQNRSVREEENRAQLEAPVGTLVCLSGPLEGQSFLVSSAGVIIGRDQKRAGLVIDDQRIEQHHLWVGLHDGRVFAIDEGSRSGTYLNQMDAPRIEKVALQSGDTLILGDDVTRFIFLR